MTCDQNKTWISPESLTYQIADQISMVEKISGGLKDSIQQNVYRTHNDVRKQLLPDFGLEPQNGLFSNNPDYRNYTDKILNKSQATVEGSATASVLRIALENLATLKLNAAAKAHLDCLPLVFEDNPEEYFEFISKYGTHFCASGDFGVLIKQVSSSKFPFNGKNSLESTSGGHFNYTLEKYGVKVDNYSFSEEFLSQSTVKKDFYGGDKNLILNSFNATIWNPTIAAKPWLLKCNLAPISHLIDQNDKKQSMDLAVQAYLNKIYLGEVVDTLNGFLNDYPVNTFEIHSMTNQANKLQLNSVPQADSVTEISTRMAPGKFWENVTLCFRSDCADNGSPLCAEMNSFTSVYIDINNETDRNVL